MEIFRQLKSENDAKPKDIGDKDPKILDTPEFKSAVGGAGAVIALGAPPAAAAAVIVGKDVNLNEIDNTSTAHLIPLHPMPAALE